MAFTRPQHLALRLFLTAGRPPRHPQDRVVARLRVTRRADLERLHLVRAPLLIWTIGYLVLSCGPIFTGDAAAGGGGPFAGAVLLLLPWLIGVLVLSRLVWLTTSKGRNVSPIPNGLTVTTEPARGAGAGGAVAGPGWLRLASLHQADLVGLLALVIVLARQPHALLRPQFVWEEAAAFWATTFTIDAVAYLVEPWAGYLAIPSRAAFLIARMGPFEAAPAVLIVLHAIAIGLVARFLSSDRLAPVIPSRSVRLGWGLAIAALPVAEPYVSILSVQWFLAIYVATMSLIAPRRSDYLGVVVAAMSGLAPLTALPLFIRRSPSWRAMDRRGILLGLGAVVQAIVLLGSDRRPAIPGLEPGTLLGIAAVVATVVGAMWLPRLVPFVTRLALGYLSIATLVIGVLSSGVSGRYLLAASAAIALAGVAGIAERRPVGLAIGLLVVAAMAWWSPIGKVPNSDWAAHAHCIGGRMPCVVPAIPGMWAVDWPGDPFLYRAPTGMGPGGAPIWGGPMVP